MSVLSMYRRDTEASSSPLESFDYASGLMSLCGRRGGTRQQKRRSARDQRNEGRSTCLAACGSHPAFASKGTTVRGRLDLEIISRT